MYVEPIATDQVPSGVPANRDRLFLAACVSLIVTAMTFAIRAGILTELGETFAINDVELGWVNSMAFLGFPVAMIVGGLIYNNVGPKNLMWLAFVSHLAGLVLTVYAGGFWGLIISTFFIGFANGSVEAACNPMIVDMYPDKKSEMLNKFHVWFPGGIVIGSLIANFFGAALGWQGLIWIMVIPTLAYALLIFGQEFPRSQNIVSDTGANLKGLLNPLYIFMFVCMSLTAASEFSTTQWVEKILGATGAQPLLVLALVSGLMATGRFFAGPIIHNLNPAGVLWVSSILTTIGIYLLSTQSGAMIYVAAIVFALGICYFWPTMLGFVSEYTPGVGALGLSLMGGIGMFSMTVWNPVIGGWLESATAAATAAGAVGAEADLIAGRETLQAMIYFPIILIVLFGALYFYMRNRPQVHADEAVLDPKAMATPGSAR
ncbi:MFS transporter [Neolewinella sp.]|uniref:MFS transporter n=1 Tax=Neolewinella sp. TaxID=2993543 RepID=UPI003B517E8F